MRIAHVTSHLDRDAAGVGVVVSALSAQQQALGCDVRVFGLESGSWTENDKDVWQGAPAEAFKSRGFPKTFGYAPNMPDALERFAPDIVHLHGLWMYPGIAVRRWHRRTQKPYIYSIHGMLSPVALSFSPKKKLIGGFLFQKSVLEEAALLHATTEQEADDIRKFGLRNDTAIVPLGINVAPVPVYRHDEYRRVLSLGRLHPQKGLDRLIKAWSRLESSFPNWVLDIAGPDIGGHKAELQKLVAGLNLRRVMIGAPVHGMERDARMAAADIFVLPTRGENFALTVAESLMMETPVIATQAAPWSGLVREGCGWWIEQGVDALVTALKQAMGLSDAERHALGKRGRAWMLREYTWTSVATNMLEVCQKVLRGHKNLDKFRFR